MTHSVIAFYDNFRAAVSASNALLEYGFHPDQIQIAARARGGAFWFHQGPFDSGVIQNNGLMGEAGVGAFIGAGIAAAAGLSGGFVATAASAPDLWTALLYGLGWAFISALLGGFIGMTVGSMIGLGIPQDEAQAYADTIRHSRVLVIIRAEQQNLSLLRDILTRYRPDGIDEHAPELPQPGWMGWKSPKDFEVVFAENQRNTSGG